MILRMIPVLLIALTFNACAEPKYLSQSDSSGLNQSQTECQAKFFSGHCVELVWEKMPTESDFGSFLFKTFRQDQGDEAPLLEDLGSSVAVMLWMPGMGHGSAPVTVDRLAVGTYRARNVFFTMRGQWEIHFQIRDEKNVQDETIIPIDI